MRVAQVSGTSGAGSVTEIHEIESVAALEEWLEERGIEARAIAPLEDWVSRGVAYDGSAFIDASEPSPEPTPEPQPLTVAQVRAELDRLREGVITEYIATWGEASRRELWPELATEIRELAEIPDALLAVPEKYPAIRGFLQGSGNAEPTALEIHATASALRGYKSSHVKLLRETEIGRAVLIAKYQGLTEPEKLAWDSEAEWEAEHGA